MPIKDWSKYPKNWKKIRQEILERAGYQCECLGECLGNCGYPTKCPEAHGMVAINFKGKVVLTIAHLNHNTKDNRRKNLKALCNRCHLRYDRDHHREERRKTLEAKKKLQYVDKQANERPILRLDQ